MVAQQPQIITPAPSVEDLDISRRQDIDLGSLGPILLTAVPPSILTLALTNLPAVSRLLWSEFLDDNTPAWFTALPTDVQGYLSGEFGPTKTAASISATATLSTPDASTTFASSSSEPTASETAIQVDSFDRSNEDGLPLWAKIAIGIAVPLIVIAVAALILCWCFHHRRQRWCRATNSASSYRSSLSQPRGEQHLPLRGGHASVDANREMAHSNHNLSPDSDAYGTTLGGPSYEDISTKNPVQKSSRGSRQSVTSLHSVPEVPEPFHHAHGRSRDLSTSPDSTNGRRKPPLNSLYSEYGSKLDRSMQMDPRRTGQGIYAGGHNPYPTDASGKWILAERGKASTLEATTRIPPLHPSTSRTARTTTSVTLFRIRRHGGIQASWLAVGIAVSAQEVEPFMPAEGGVVPPVERQDHEDWPLRALQEGGYATAGEWKAGLVDKG